MQMRPAGGSVLACFASTPVCRPLLPPQPPSPPSTGGSNIAMIVVPLVVCGRGCGHCRRSLVLLPQAQA